MAPPLVETGLTECDSRQPSHCNWRFQGFTLIELLIVISIIVMLIAILLPALRAARNAAQSVVCLSNQRQIGIGFAIYANDHDQWLPPGTASQQSASETATWGLHMRWEEILMAHYLKGPFSPKRTGRALGVFACPSESRDAVAPTNAPWCRTNYGINIDLIYGRPNYVRYLHARLSPSMWVEQAPSHKSGRIEIPSETALMGDSGGGITATTGDEIGPGPSTLPCLRHSKEWNVLYFDLHAASHKEVPMDKYIAFWGWDHVSP